METSTSITRTQVNRGHRMGALPRYFGAMAIQVENLIYDVAGELVRHYNGAFWEFYELDNGGFYMVPDFLQHHVTLDIADNYFSDDMSADAAGIVCCLFAYSRAANVVTGRMQEALVDLYERLRDYAGQHPERALIFAAID